MSKKGVLEAVQAATAGRLDQARNLLEGIDLDFVRKRLAILAAQAETSTGAKTLWDDLFMGEVLTPVARQPDPQSEPQRHDAQAPSIPHGTLPSRLTLDNPGPFLQALSQHDHFEIDLDEIEVSQMFALVAMATLARQSARTAIQFVGRGTTDAARFAHAVGMEDVIAGLEPSTPGESGRTAKLRRIQRPNQIETLSREIAGLILPEGNEVKQAIKYVIVELLRNAIQHSNDPLGGGVVAAQRMDLRQQYTRPSIQVTVADAGQGIFAALAPRHPGLGSAREALEKALWPHYSGTFDEGGTGSAENAGMGLFIISEMAKLTGSRMLLASRGAALVLRGDPDDVDKHSLTFLNPEGLGFPGTLVSFELPIGSLVDFDSLLETVRKRARERTPRRQINQWLRFEGRPATVLPLLIGFMAEDTIKARGFSSETLQPAIIQRKPVALDFRGLDVCTQSFLHSLLFEALRLAWALQVPIYAENTSPAVRSGLQMLENYALSG